MKKMQTRAKKIYKMIVIFQLQNPVKIFDMYISVPNFPQRCTKVLSVMYKKPIKYWPNLPICPSPPDLSPVRDT